MSYKLYSIFFELIISSGTVVLLNRYLNVHAFFSFLIAPLILGITVGKSFTEIISVMQTGFETLLYIIL